MSKGIVVDHTETDVRYAISEHNFNPKTHKRVRDLKPGESIISFQPKPRLQAETDDQQAAQERAELLAQRQQPEVETVEEQEPYTPTQAEIDKMVDDYTHDELKDMAKEDGLPVSGTKAELATSLLTHWGPPTEDDAPAN